jgi:hypothetical protein
MSAAQQLLTATTHFENVSPIFSAASTASRSLRLLVSAMKRVVLQDR